MTIEECIKRGQDEDMVYIGLQHGNECWGDTSLGGYGKAEDSECHMPCSRDNSKFCGGGYRNLVYDLRDLNRGSQKNAAKVAAKCKEDGKSDFVDCTRLGGYDRVDPCKQTCLSKDAVSDEQACPMKCANQADGMTFRSDDDYGEFVRHCTLKCDGITDAVPYKGCYKDQQERDLPILIGEQLSPSECFDKAKLNPAIKYVGLQYGGQDCWGGKSVGKYGKVDNSECNMVCAQDPEVTCGAGWRNSVYDVTNYKSKSNPCDQKPKDCGDDGYDPADKCF